MIGNITRRGANSWRLKFDVGRDANGKRITRFVTVKGTKKQAQAELARLVAAHDAGTLVEPSKLTVAEYMRAWIETVSADISPKTAERYRQLIERQIVPHLGTMSLQKLKPIHVETWHATLLKAGGHDGGRLSAQTVLHAHRTLSKGLQDAVRTEVIVRNVASVAKKPKVTHDEMPILTADEVAQTLAAMRDTSIYPQIVVLLATGARRGEVAGMQWQDIDFENARLRIERSVEKTKTHGLRIKAPKTKHGRRTIALPQAAVDVLKEHRKAQLEIRLALGLGKPPADAFVFGTVEGAVRDPDRLTQDWKRFAAARGLPRVTLHALRHSHASALIASGTDPVVVSRRLGHGSPAVTMSVYAHLFDRGDEQAAEQIDAVLKAKP